MPSERSVAQELAEDGLLTFRDTPQGRRYFLTAKGRDFAEELLRTSPSAREFARRILAENHRADDPRGNGHHASSERTHR